MRRGRVQSSIYWTESAHYYHFKSNFSFQVEAHRNISARSSPNPGSTRRRQKFSFTGWDFKKEPAIEEVSHLVWLRQGPISNQIAAAGSPSCIFIGSCVN